MHASRQATYQLRKSKSKSSPKWLLAMPPGKVPPNLTVARFHSAIGAWEPALIAAEAAETNFVQLRLDRLRK